MTGFTVYPAIDVRDGRVVRLAQGDYARETRYEGAPLQVAQRYAAQGAEWLHLVDLDAARAGGYTLAPLLKRIADDGRGGAIRPGNGLTGMRERIEALGGRMRIDARKGEGTRVDIRVPLAGHDIAPEGAQA